MDNLNEKSPPSIDTNTVRYIANLIRLKINDVDAVMFSKQFSQIIEYFQTLTEINTQEIQPANENWPFNNIFREDVIQPSISREEFLTNAPDREGDYVKVAQVFDVR